MVVWWNESRFVYLTAMQLQYWYNNDINRLNHFISFIIISCVIDEVCIFFLLCIRLFSSTFPFKPLYTSSKIGFVVYIFINQAPWWYSLGRHTTISFPSASGFYFGTRSGWFTFTGACFVRYYLVKSYSSALSINMT